jgi:hypothetical protein
MSMNRQPENGPGHSVAGHYAQPRPRTMGKRVERIGSGARRSRQEWSPQMHRELLRWMIGPSSSDDQVNVDLRSRK